MLRDKHVTAIIPAFNEAPAIEQVVRGLVEPKHEGSQVIDRIIVVDNNSVDGTAVLAQQGGAQAIHEMQQDYGSACFAGACTAIRQGASGILFSELISGATVLESQFRIIRTGASL